MPTISDDKLAADLPRNVFTFPTLSEQLAQQIATAILTEKYPPGYRMKEIDLAEGFNVSRASIREALRVLEVQGLVQIEPRKGARVTQLSADEVDDLYEIRASLLCVAARRVATRRDPEFLSRAKALLNQIVEHATDETQDEYFAAVYALSELTADGAGSERLAGLIRSFSRQVARYTRLSLQSSERRNRSAKRWKQYVHAVVAGDPGRAEEVMRELVTGSQTTIREMLNRPTSSAGKGGR